MSPKMLSETVLPILLAGGEGTRLRPITSDLPKPLIPVDGVPAICRILDTLSALGAVRTVITVRYRADDIIGYLGDSYKGIRLYYSREDDMPRGTAGGVRDAWDAYAAPGDTDALIISGDAVFTCDLAAFAVFHKEQRADASLLCVSVPDPGAFGIVIADTNGHITGFSEKPCAAETLSDTVNTGIYCLTRAFLTQIPQDGTPDFGQDIFPHALRRGQTLYAYVSTDYWCDVGSFSAYLSCSLDISAGKITDTDTPRMRTVLPPHISDSSVGRDCFVPSTASVRGSILFDGVHIGSGTSVSGSVLCRDVHVGDGTVIEPGCVIGSGCTIGGHLHLPRGTRLEPGTALSEVRGSSHEDTGASRTARDVFDGSTALSVYLSDIGYALSVCSRPEPETAVAFARALAAFAGKQRCSLLLCRAEEAPSVCCTAQLVCEALKCTDAASAPISVFCADETVPLSAARMPSLPIPDRHADRALFRVVFLRRGGIPCAAVFDDTGLYPPRQAERTLDACFSDALAALRHPPTNKALPKTAELLPIHSISADALISAYIARYAVSEGSLSGHAPFIFSCGSTPSERLLARLLTAMGGEEHISAPVHFSVQAPNEDSGDILCPLSVTDLRELTKGTAPGTCTHWTLLSSLIAHRQNSPAPTAPFPTPRTAGSATSRPLSIPVCAPEEICADYRYSHAPSISDHASDDDPSVLSRRYAAMEAEDAVLLARDIAVLLAEHQKPLETLQFAGSTDAASVTQIPSCRRHGLAVSHADPRHPLMLSPSLSRLTQGAPTEVFAPATEGVVHRRADGHVRIVATRDHNFRIIADAYTAEAAEELFRFAKERLLCTVTSDGNR